MGSASARHVCVIGDVHGHLQLALLVAARWQQDLGVEFDAVLLAGDVGTFPTLDALDKATRRHFESSPCEVEFPAQWMADPPPAHLDRIFAPVAENGCGLHAPIVMVIGNHEGFAYLQELVPSEIPPAPVHVADLPRVGAAGRISLLPNGWRTVTPGGIVVGGLGGIDRQQRRTQYHQMAYITDDQLAAITRGQKVDILLTHAGPAVTQPFPRGSRVLDRVVESRVARVWCHGHSIDRDHDRITSHEGTVIVPLHDAVFGKRHGPNDGEPGQDAWCHVVVDEDAVSVTRERPAFWRDFHRRAWIPRQDGQLIAPQLAGGETGSR